MVLIEPPLLSVTGFVLIVEVGVNMEKWVRVQCLYLKNVWSEAHMMYTLACANADAPR